MNIQLLQGDCRQVLKTLPDRLSNDAKATTSRLRVQKHRERYKALRNAASVTSPVSASVSVSPIKDDDVIKTDTTPIRMDPTEFRPRQTGI